MELINDSNRIYAEDDNGNTIAEIVFSVDNQVYTITRTFVDDSLRGQGIAGKLMEKAVQYIEENDGTVQATCSYAKHWLEKNR